MSISSKQMGSWQAKVVASSFILLTLLGNFWILFIILGQEVPAFMLHGAQIAVAGVVMGGLSMLWQAMNGTAPDQVELPDSQE